MAALSFHDRTWHYKLLLRLIAALSSAGAAVIFHWCLQQVTDDVWGGYRDKHYWVAAFPALGVEILYFLLTTIYLVIRRRPVHPGWSVGTDLCLIIYLTTIVSIAMAEGIFDWEAVIDEDRFDYLASPRTNRPDDFPYRHPDSPCSPYPDCKSKKLVRDQYREFVTWQFVGAACLLLAIPIHCILFLWACYDTYLHNNPKARTHFIEEPGDRGKATDASTEDHIPPEAQPLLADGEPNDDREEGAEICFRS